jgi:thiamine monophosphate kinase
VTHSTLITTDILVEGQHFRCDWISVADLGYESLAVNLSDISAIGGKPRFSRYEAPASYPLNYFGYSTTLKQKSLA